jgi:hypothetical protein
MNFIAVVGPKGLLERRMWPRWDGNKKTLTSSLLLEHQPVRASDNLQIDLGCLGWQQLWPQRNLVQLEFGVEHSQEVVGTERKENDTNGAQSTSSVAPAPGPTNQHNWLITRDEWTHRLVDSPRPCEEIQSQILGEIGSKPDKCGTLRRNNPLAIPPTVNELPDPSHCRIIMVSATGPKAITNSIIGQRPKLKKHHVVGAVRKKSSKRATANKSERKEVGEHRCVVEAKGSNSAVNERVDDSSPLILDATEDHLHHHRG